MDDPSENDASACENAPATESLIVETKSHTQVETLQLRGDRDALSRVTQFDDETERAQS
jgi:hypothetical protein